LVDPAKENGPVCCGKSDCESLPALNFHGPVSFSAENLVFMSSALFLPKFAWFGDVVVKVSSLTGKLKLKFEDLLVFLSLLEFRG
jgi:hypothetical protein